MVLAKGSIRFSFSIDLHKIGVTLSRDLSHEVVAPQNVLDGKASVLQLELWLQCCHNILDKSHLGEVPPLAL